jgi:hypothetical protein
MGSTGDMEAGLMAVRLGNVLYAVGLLLCIGLIGVAVYAYYDVGPERGTVAAMIFAVPAVVAYALGWTCRYVLSGRTR